MMICFPEKKARQRFKTGYLWDFIQIFINYVNRPSFRDLFSQITIPILIACFMFIFRLFRVCFSLYFPLQ